MKKLKMFEQTETRPRHNIVPQTRSRHSSVSCPDTNKFKFVTKLNGNDYIYIWYMYYIVLKNVKLKQ